LSRGTSRIDELYKLIAAVSMGLIGSIAVNSLLLSDQFIYSRLMLVIGWVFCVLFTAVGRLIFGVVVGILRRHQVGLQRVLIVGLGTAAHSILERMHARPELGYQVLGAISPPRLTDERALWDVP